MESRVAQRQPATTEAAPMFKLFRRQEAPPTPPKGAAPVAARARPAHAAPLAHEPPPVPEVTEDHDESAWDLWEQSQFQLDSQMGGLSPSDSVKVKQPTPSQMGDLDPFGRVGKNDR
jgi:hypothetical protein